MVLTLKSYDPLSRVSDVSPGDIAHPGGKGLLQFEVRILTRYGEVIVDFDNFEDLLSWTDNLSVEAASGSWTLKMRVSLCNEELLKKIHPGMVIEAYCARNDDPLIGVVRDPSKIKRVDTTPDLPQYAAAPSNTVTPGTVETSNSSPSPTLAGINQAFSGGASSLIARAVGHSEGNRSLSGGYNESYYGHTDPGNQAHNVGSFSVQGQGNVSPEQADSLWLNRLQEQMPAYQKAAQAAGLNPNDSRLLANFCDLYTQAPDAAVGRGGFLDQMGYIASKGGNYDAILEARMRSYVNPSTGQLDAPGFGNSPTALRADQNRRMSAVDAVLSKNPGATSTPTPTVNPTPAPLEAKTVSKSQTLEPGTYGGVRLSAEQIQNAQTIARVGHQVGASDRDIQIALATAMQESSLENLDHGDADSLGLFQQRPSQDWGTSQQIQTPEYAAKAFFLGAGTNPGLLSYKNRNSVSIAQAAQQVQRSAYPDAYAQWEGMSSALMQAGLGAGTSAAGFPGSSPQSLTASLPAAVIGPSVKPVDDPYLDKCPYLLMRGIITDYGRSTDGSETVLCITGESYGKIYKDAFVLLDLQAPELASTALEIRNSSQLLLGVSLIYYRLLKEWVEGFWGQSTGWEARTRVIPFPPNYITRINNEGSVWAALQFLAIPGFFHMFTDHTGAICWEKLPWSSREQALIAGRNWEDLPILDCPSWKIVSWDDRLSGQGINNFLRCTVANQGVQSGQQSLSGSIYNLGSIRQYGGPSKRELTFPIGITGDQYYTSPARRQQQATNAAFVDLCALEAIRWYDRPVQRCGVTARGEAAWRINMRVSLTEDWHCPGVKPAEYYCLARTHTINVARGSWTTQMDLVRDRRNRYLGIGVGDVPVILSSSASADALGSSRFTQSSTFSFADVKLKGNLDYAAPNTEGQMTVSQVNNIEIPLVPDEYYFFDRFSGKIIPIGNDPIAWANSKVVPKLGEQAQPVILTPTQTATGFSPGTTGPAATFTPVDRIYTSHLSDPTPPGSYDFTLARGGTPYNDEVVTPVPAIASGTVVTARVLGGYGNCVEIKDGSGRIWLMGHLSSIAVQEGQTITRGTIIGNQGQTGHAFGEHVHCQIYEEGHPPNLPRSVTIPLIQDYFGFVSGGKEPTLVNGFSPDMYPYP